MEAVRARSCCYRGAGALAVGALIACWSSGVGLTTASALPLKFGAEGSRAGEISEQPRGIAIDQVGGYVYISDRDNNRIEKFDREGNFVRAWGWGVADGETEALQICTVACYQGLGGEFFAASGAGE